ncbi:copper-binding protein, partial [Candidatus Nitrosopelagicus sp.]|nr:copper-binding protein [Candidatus Nitrosopelagicus sp.]
MRNYIIIPVLILIFTCVTHNAFAENLTVKTESDSYELGSTVVILGTAVSDNVVIQIKDPSDTTILIRTIPTDAESFSFDFNIPDYYETGQYTIVASIVNDEIPEITNTVFDVTPKMTTPPIDVSVTQTATETPSGGGGCLIATAAYGSEMAPQVQFLREIRDNTVLQTQSGTSFMTVFNQFYYSFSPTVADYERE